MKLPYPSRSIAFRLIVAVLAVELLSSIVVIALSFGYERHTHFRSFDVMLHGRADSVLGAVQDADDPNADVLLDQADLHVPPEDVYEVWDISGHLLGRSSNWNGAGPSLPTHPLGDFSQVEINDRHYRLLRMHGSRTVDPNIKGGIVHQLVVVYGSPTSRLWHAIHGAVEFYAVGSLVLLLVTGPLIAWLLHHGLLPLRELAHLAAQVSADSWEFSPPASARATPELAPLTHALESVLQRLERSFLQQQAFVSDAAHELKTAVAVLKSSLQLMAMKRRTAQEYEEGLERCLTDSSRLEKLVADMLTLARAEQTNIPDPEKTADLDLCVRKAMDRLETIAKLRNVQITFHALEDAPRGSFRVETNPSDGALLVSNLVLNALQHSPASSKVELRLRREDGTDPSRDTVVFQIQDHGSGIAPEALPHVFDRFYRGDASRARNTGGSGLGLAIAKAIVVRGGGAIEIASQANPLLPFQGTTVTVRLPVAQSK